MSEPVPYRDQPEEARSPAARCVARVRVARDWPLAKRTAFYWSVRARAAGGRRASFKPALRRALAGAGALACAVGIAIALPHRDGAAVRVASAPRGLEPSAAPASPPTGWNRVDLEDLGTLELSASFDLLDLEGERQLRLSRGILRAQILRQDPERPVTVVTPHLRIVVVGTRFDVRADEALTTVDLIEGAVRVESGGAAVLLKAGESIRSDDARLGPAPSSGGAPDEQTGPPLSLHPPARPLPPAPPAASPAASVSPRPRDCSALPTPARQRRCWALEARGRGLGAQSALLALAALARDAEGQPDQALEYFRLYELRFPRGDFAPEAALGILETLREQGRDADAIAAATAFEQRFATEPRAAEVALVRAELLCRQPDRAAEGRGVLERLQRAGPAPLRESAERLRATCLNPPARPDIPDPAGQLWDGPAPILPAPPG